MHTSFNLSDLSNDMTIQEAELLLYNVYSLINIYWEAKLNSMDLFPYKDSFTK